MLTQLSSNMCLRLHVELATGRWFSPGTLVTFTNKTDRNDITEILLKVALNTIIPILTLHVTLEKWEKARSMQQNK